MPYQAQINRDSPGLLIFLLDQSGSMKDPYPAEPGSSKAQGLADGINRLLLEVVLSCTRPPDVRDPDGYRNYLDVAVIGYTTDDQENPEVGSALQGALAGREYVTTKELAQNPFREESRKKKIPDGAGGLVEVDENFPIWIEPIAKYGTPINAALNHAFRIAENWIASHPNNFPPLVFHITDGDSTDGEPVASGQRLAGLKTSDGNLLLLNCHISSAQPTAVIYPDSEAALPADAYAKQLFDMSSTLPPEMVKQAEQEGFNVTADSRAFVYNADLVKMIQFLNIGTIPVKGKLL